MKLNNPMLFNGQLLATYQTLFERLGIGSNLEGVITGGFITSSLIDNSSLAKVTVADLNYDATQTVSAKLADLSGAIQNQLDALKTYEVTAAADGAIVVTSSLTAAKDSFEVGLKLAKNGALTQSADGLAVIPSAVINQSGLKLAKLTSDDYAGVYELQLNGVTLGETINIPKDQFLKAASYVPSAEVLRLEFQLPNNDGSNIVDIPVGGLVDEYSAGNGIAISNVVNGTNEISVAVEDDYLTAESGKLAVTNVAGTLESADSAKLATEGAVINYVTPISGELTKAIAAVETGLLPKGKYSAVEYIDTLPSVLTEAPIVNTLYVDSEGQTGIVLAGTSAVIDISQEFIDSADAIVSGATELVTAGAVADYVTTISGNLAIDYNNKFTEVNRALETLSADLGGDLTDAVKDLSGLLDAETSARVAGDEFLSGAISAVAVDLDVVSSVLDERYTELTETTTTLNTKLSTVSGELAQDIADLAAVKKFVKVANIDAVPSAVADTLYYTEAGQAKVYGADGWQSLSMEAVTDLSGVVSDQTTATSQAIKTYVDNAKSEVSASVKAVADDLTETRAQAAQIYEAKIEFGSVDNATVSGRVIAVYDAQNEQCYPSIKYANGVSTIGLDEADVAKAEYTVVYAAALATLA